MPRLAFYTSLQLPSPNANTPEQALTSNRGSLSLQRVNIRHLQPQEVNQQQPSQITFAAMARTKKAAEKRKEDLRRQDGLIKAKKPAIKKEYNSEELASTPATPLRRSPRNHVGEKNAKSVTVKIALATKHKEAKALVGTLEDTIVDQEMMDVETISPANAVEHAITDLEMMGADAQPLANNLEETNADLEMMRAEYELTSSLVLALQARIGNLKSLVEEQKTEKQKSLKNLSSMATEKKNFEQELIATKERNRALDSAHRTLQSQCDYAASSSKQEIEQLTTRLTSITAFEIEIPAPREKIHTLTEKLAKSKARNKTIQIEKSSLREANENSANELASMGTQIENLTNRLHRVQGRKKNLKLKFATLKLRFLEQAKRFVSKEGEGKKLNRTLVKAGNQAAHDGNIAADSVLFSMGLFGIPKESNLEDVCSGLYGCGPTTARDGYPPTLAKALEAWVTINSKAIGFMGGQEKYKEMIAEGQDIIDNLRDAWSTLCGRHGREKAKIRYEENSGYQSQAQMLAKMAK